ncbi:ABC transporter substrate-binding protein [Tsukamurella sp. 8F]|uniref:ABC transporter substrate-binding protein n=1 Tax=unclassified Tsukamurella TaxID=2633480 RepID=UPI0023B9B42B|nr:MULTISPECIES: ABC transporter substrate-binding protein [unclassified Tsukamurella]MDF0529502.1 ABC transporter substrate-binding protein [Tsukamurella sp. 8J]MDF0585810.1 ABC transporter substrate-binding protein [Tsukamurella sp. 8F]
MKSIMPVPRRTAVLPILTAAALLLSSCGFGASTSSSSSSAQVPELAPDQKVSIVFESYNYGLAGAWTDTFNSLIAAFSKQHPNITVKAQKPHGNSPNPAADAVSSVQTQSVAGSPPDVAQLGFGDIDFTIHQLGAQSLDGLVGKKAVQQNFDGEKYPYAPSARGLGDWNGTTYGVPFVFSTPVLYYNATLFQRAGLDPAKPPTTWAEAGRDAAAIKAQTGKGGLYIDCLTKSASDWCYQSLIRSAGGQVISDDRKTLSFADPAALQVTQMAQGLVKSGATPNYTQQQGYESFARGDTGMLLESSSLQSTFMKGAAGKWDLRAAKMPGFGSAPAVPTNSGVALFVFSKDAAKQRAAWELIQFLTSNEAFTTIAKGIGYLPLRTGLVNDPAYLAQWAAANKGLLQPNLDQLTTMKPWLSMPGNSYKQIQTNLMTAVEKVVYQGADPKPTLTAAQSQSTSLLPAR